MMGRIWKYLTGALAAAGLVLFALLQREQAKRAKDERDDAEAQRDQLVDANEALQDAQQRGQKNVEDMAQRVRRNDFGGMDNRW